MGQVTSDRTGTELSPALVRAFGHVLWRARARVGAALDETLPPGVDIHAYAALLALPAGSTRSQQSVADAIDVSRTTMAKVAKGLADRGLVTRVRNAEDRRSYSLTRTPAGAATARRWRRHAEDVEGRLTEGFGEDEREELRGLLRRAVAAELPTDVPEPLLDSIGFLTAAAHSRLHRGLAERLTPWGIQPSHMGTLLLLDGNGPMVQAEIGRALGTSAAHVVQLVDDLEQAGLVSRRRDPEDRRVQTVHLKPSANAAVSKIEQIAHAESRRRFDDTIGVRDTDRLSTLLRALVTGP